MKNTITLAIALTLVCGTFAFAQDNSLQHKVQRKVESSRYETPQEARDRILADLAKNPSYEAQETYKLLSVKNDLIKHYYAGGISDKEREALELYKLGQVSEAYAKLGFNLDQAVKNIDQSGLYRDNSFALHLFQWPVKHQFEDSNTYLEANRLAAARQTTLEVVQQKVDELAETNPKRALRIYAQTYYKTMDSLLNRYAINQSTEQEKEAIAKYKAGDLHAAYKTLGFSLDTVVEAVEALDFYSMSMHPTFFKWPVNPDFNK